MYISANACLEEVLASLAGNHTIVSAGCMVAANLTDVTVLCCHGGSWTPESFGGKGCLSTGSSATLCVLDCSLESQHLWCPNEVVLYMTGC